MIDDWTERALHALEKSGSGSPVILVNLDQQKLYLVQDRTFVRDYSVSTSRYGTGCEQDSYRTPTGIHRIAEKIGKDCRRGEIFRARIATGELAQIILDTRPAGVDVITSRILRLQGMEPGVNQGEGVDSYQRYIYIHGTNEEGLIGQAASTGCIRMKNDDVIDLFDRVEVGTPVLIE